LTDTSPAGSLLGQDEGFSYMSVTLDLDDGTYGVDLSGTVGGCSQVTMQVTGQDVSPEVDTAAFTVTPDGMASLPKIPLDGLYLSLSSPAMVAAGHGLPLVGKGRVIVQLGRVPDGLYGKLKRKAEEEAKKKKEDPNVLPIKALSTLMHTEPDFLSDGVRVLHRGAEVGVIEEQGHWQRVWDVKSGDIGWINRNATIEQKIDLSPELGGRGQSVTADEVEIAGRG